jgi:hypothetical protein
MKDDIYDKIEKKCREYGVVAPIQGEAWEVSLEKILMLIKVLESKKKNDKKFKHKGWGSDE